jgi:hypothetical protein
MIRGWPDGRSESGVRKGKAPVRVDKNSVEPGKNRRVLLIRPGELAVEKGNFKEAQPVNEPVEGGGLDGVEIATGFVARRAD